MYEENVIQKYKSTKPPTYPPIKEILKKTKVPTDKLKLYMNSLRDKLKTIYKDDKFRKTTITDQESSDENSKNLHRNLLKRRLNINPVIDRTELLVSNRRTDLDEYEAVEGVDNDIQYDDDLETLRDQIAQARRIRRRKETVAVTERICLHQTSFLILAKTAVICKIACLSAITYWELCTLSILLRSI